VPNQISVKAAHDMLAELFRWTTALQPLRSPSQATQPAAAAPVVA
jgi:hypothetical protein